MSTDDSHDQRCYVSAMGQWRAKNPFEDNPFIDGFLDWLDAPQGQDRIAALDLVSDALAGAGVEAQRRKIVWAVGKRLSIRQTVARIHAAHQDVAREMIETHVPGGLESCVPDGYGEAELEELRRLVEPWLDDYELKSRAAGE